MRRYWLIACFLLSFPTLLSAQTPSRELVLQDSLRLVERIAGKESEAYINVLDELSRYYERQGKYVQCIDIMNECVSMSEKVYGKYSEKCALFMGNKGMLYVSLAQYANAKEQYREMLDVYASLEHLTSPHVYVRNLGNAATVFLATSEYGMAEQLALKCLKMIDTYQVKNEETTHLALSVLGMIYTGQGKYAQAEKYLLDALPRLPKEHPEYSKLLNNIGLLYFRMGLYEQSRHYFIEAYEVKKATLPTKHPLHGSTLGNIGLVSAYIGDFAAGEKYLLEAIESDKATLGDKHRNSANNLLNLGFVYMNMGDYQHAEEYIVQGSGVLRKLLGDKHIDYAATLSTLSKLNIEIGRYDKAIQYAIESLSIIDEIDQKHPERVLVLQLLGKGYMMNKDYKEAKKILHKALKTVQEVLGEHHDSYPESLYLLGLLYNTTGDYALAETHYLQALDAYKNVHSESHPRYVLTLNSLGELYQRQGDYAKASECLLEAFERTKNQYVQSTNYMSERQRELYWETLRYRHETIYPNFAYSNYQSHPSVACLAYDNALFVKGLLLNSSTAIHNSILQSNDTLLIQQWKRLQQMHVQILALSESDPTSVYVQELKSEAEKLEKELTELSSILRADKSQWGISWQSVRSALQSDEVAIEFIVVPHVKSGNTYAALLLRHDSPYPVFIPLFSESALQDIVGDDAYSVYDYSSAGGKLHDMLLRQLLPYVQVGDKIYFSPAGLLHQLAIEYLPLDASTSMQERYYIRRLSSTRELVKSSEASAITHATLYGGILYDMDGEELLAESEEYAHHRFSTRSADGSTHRQGVQYLPGTKKEVDYIHQVLQDHSIRTQLYVGGKGNEESFKALDGKETHILHIATHGFFWSDESVQSSDYYLRRMLSPDQKSVPIDPLNRCGLLLAGANLSLSGNQDELPEGVQDGILTAKEISLLDLSHTQVVVLSACETGKGDITAEGVFGLQRSLKQAGVHSIIMSLWPVDDAATQLLMQEFYAHWIKDKVDKHVAFQKAQQVVKQKYGKPEYWAGFILLD